MTDLEHYNDPHFTPPADITGAQARAYEDKIVSLLREHLLPHPGPTIVLESIDRRGEQPHTEIIFRYTDRRDSSSHAVRARLWEEGWTVDEDSDELLLEADEVGRWIFSRWLDGTLEPIDPD